MTKTPSEIVDQYYHALYSGNLNTVKELMTEQSYMMTLESFGSRLSLSDEAFRSLLEEIEDDPSSLEKVEVLLSEEIISRNKSPMINIMKSEPNGPDRETVHFTEDGKEKKLYFSKEKSGWKINYYAGRPIPQSFFSSVKKWILSFLPS